MHVLDCPCTLNTAQNGNPNLYLAANWTGCMILYAGLAFIITLIATPKIAHFMKRHHITGKDIHKPLQPDIPEMGGVSYIFSLTFVYGLAFLLLQEPMIVAALSVGLLSALIGAFDDLKGLSQKKKLILTVFVGTPLLFFVEDTSINFIAFSVDFSWGYYILVLCGVAACTNATNILAGFNGEEAGLGVIAAFALGVCCIMLDNSIPLLLVFSLCGALAAFLIFNRYPAHIFPGDVGTLPIGALISAAVILGKIEVLGFLVLLPAIIEFFLKLRIWFKGKHYGPTKVIKGRLYPPSYASVANVVTRRLLLTERTLVIILWAIEGLCGLIAISAAFLMI